MLFFDVLPCPPHFLPFAFHPASANLAELAMPRGESVFRHADDTLDEVRALLTDNDGWRVGVAAYQAGDDRTVNHPEAVETADLQFGIDHSHVVHPHLAGADRVVVGLAGPKRVFSQIIIGDRARTRHALGDEKLLE